MASRRYRSPIVQGIEHLFSRKRAVSPTKPARASHPTTLLRQLQPVKLHRNGRTDRVCEVYDTVGNSPRRNPCPVGCRQSNIGGRNNIESAEVPEVVRAADDDVRASDAKKRTDSPGEGIR
jgi:hypothetical protein